jgi:dihydroxy-acid dehydratase
MVGHIAPEAARGGPIGLLREGDAIFIDASTRELRTDADLASRRGTWQPTAPRVTRGVLAKYARLVGSAAEGAVTQAFDDAPATAPAATPSRRKTDEESMTQELIGN